MPARDYFLGSAGGGSIAPEQRGCFRTPALFRCSTPDQAERIALSRLSFIQRDLRKTPAEMADLKKHIATKGVPGKIILTIFEDGKIYVHDGRHRIQALLELGKDSLSLDDCLIEEYRYEDFKRVVFAEDERGKLDLNFSWLTPFDPRQQFRVAQLKAFKTLIKTFYDLGVPPEKIRDFIIRHPELYLVPDDTAADKKTMERDWPSYLATMQKSMGIKIAQLLTLMPNKGLVYDVGCGSGDQSFAYAKLFPDLLVAGVDLALEAIDFARSNFQAENLLYLLANTCQELAFDGTAAGVIASSVEHEIFSYNKFCRQALRDFYATAFQSLKAGGKFGSRDFISPVWPKRVRLRLPTAVENGPGEFGKLSRADLFRHYAKNFITADFPQGVSYQEIPNDGPDWAVFEMDGLAAANFMHRMEYRKNWVAELKEQYLYWNLDEKIKELEAAGFRVDYATEIVNTWIWLNWWRGRVFVTDTAGNKIDLPPNNALFHCTKPGPNDPQRLTIKSVKHGGNSDAFRLKSYHPKGKPDQVFDVIHVPNETEHFLVYEMDKSGEVWIYTENLTEEPALLYHSQASEHHTSRYSGYTYKGFDALPEGLAREQVSGESEGMAYFPIPGISDERVQVHHVQIADGDSTLKNNPHLHRDTLTKLLSACQTGAFPDARVEAALYELARLKGVKLLPWFDGDLPLSEQGKVKNFKMAPSHHALDDANEEGDFEASDRSSDFARIVHLDLDREWADGKKEGFSRDYLEPVSYSHETHSVIPYFKKDGQVFVGFEKRPLAAVQSKTESSQLAVVPAWRLPKGITSHVAANNFLRDRMIKDFGLYSLNVTPLGAGYFPSLKNTPERVTPFAVEVDGAHPPRDLVFIPLNKILEEIDHIPDLHSKIALNRLAHALDQFSEV